MPNRTDGTTINIRPDQYPHRLSPTRETADLFFEIEDEGVRDLYMMVRWILLGTVTALNSG